MCILLQSTLASKIPTDDNDPVLKSANVTNIAILWGGAIALVLVVSVSYIIIAAASGPGGSDFLRELVERI